MGQRADKGTVEFFFDFGSPASYLAYKRLPGIAVRTGADIAYRPMLLGGVFKATGNAMPSAVPAKGAYTFNDLMRFARRFDIPMTMNPFFPINTITLMRGAAALEGDVRFPAYLDAVFHAMWREPKNLGDPAVLVEVLGASGFSPAAFQSRVEDPVVKERLKATTEEAVSRGVFGAPSFFVKGELFFGQDRLDFVEEALKA